MDYDYRFSQLTQEAANLASRAGNLEIEYNAACDFTSYFLNICEQHDIQKVCIGVGHKSVPSSINWPFSQSRSIFAMGNNKDGWPKIWGAVQSAGISGGAGNSDQHQADTSNLVDGVYHLKDGKWLKVSRPDEP